MPASERQLGYLMQAQIDQVGSEDETSLYSACARSPEADLDCLTLVSQRRVSEYSSLHIRFTYF